MDTAGGRCGRKNGMSEALWVMRATEVVGLLRAGEVSPQEVLPSLAARIAAVNPAVNALPTLCLDRAEGAAAEVEALPAVERGIFAGLPIPIKDAYDVAGVRTTQGSLAYADYVATRSDYTVEAIEAAGGIVYAKSNTPEFQAGANTFNDVFGRTLNPWDISRSPAGSSGGAAAAVATGMAWIAQGSDNACSIRYPASFCGIVGLRPTPGLIPEGPSVLPYQVLSVIGPLARTVEDVGLALDGMRGFDQRDPRSLPLAGEKYQDAGRQAERPPRAAFSMDLGIALVSREVQHVVRRAVDRLTASGLAVVDETPDMGEVDAAYRPLRAYQFAALHRDVLERHRALMKPEVVWNIEEGLKLSASELADAEVARARVRQSLLTFLDRFDFLITPTAPVPPYPVEWRYVEEIDGEKLATYVDWLVLGYAITVTGCPAISIPCGFTDGGLPVGLQIVGKPFGEEAVLRTAAWCEEVLGASMRAPIDPKKPA
jgi:amidase